MFTCQGCRKRWGRGGRGAAGGLSPQSLAEQLTPSQPGGTDYDHHSSKSPPGFSDLATALLLFAVNKGPVTHCYFTRLNPKRISPS